MDRDPFCVELQLQAELLSLYGQAAPSRQPWFFRRLNMAVVDACDMIENPDALPIGSASLVHVLALCYHVQNRWGRPRSGALAMLFRAVDERTRRDPRAGVCMLSEGFAAWLGDDPSSLQ